MKEAQNIKKENKEMLREGWLRCGTGFLIAIQKSHNYLRRYYDIII